MDKLKNILVQYKDKIMLPLDVIVGNEFDKNFVKHINVDVVEADQSINDIGMTTIAKYKEVIDNSKTIFINGTAGMYEDKRFATGTRELLEYIANSKLVKIVGGGDGVSAVKYFHFEDRFNFLSTGGGATLEYIINEGLPAINNIQDQ
jgi:phosphoglycerate kinase